MRLRYLHLQDLPPLQDVEVHFQHEDLLGRQCAIRFVVGVNGSGKTRMLRALTEVFVQLERATNLKLSFPITLAYDVGRDEDGTAHSVYLHYPGKLEEARFAIFDKKLPQETDWANLQLDNLPDDRLYKDGSLPGISTMVANMPKAVIAYTSGNPTLWEAIFDSLPDGLDVVLDAEADERPVGWTVQDERQYQLSQGAELSVTDEVDSTPTLTPRSRISFLVSTPNLKSAILAVTLLEAIDNLENNPLPEDKQAFIDRIRQEKLSQRQMRGLRGLLNEIDWLWPISVGLEVSLDPHLISNERYRSQIRQLYDAATSVLKQPEPSKSRILLFDLLRPASQNEAENSASNATTARRLADALAEGSTGYSAFVLYRNLHQLQQQGILKNIQIGLKKTNLPDVLMYDWLSDGEQEFIGRMALFHLLHDQDDALIILDEPETHFNDVWKRRIVDIIDDSLRNNVSEVVISTHSSISLTDVFETEITLLRKRDSDGTVAVVRQPVKTFGALPSEIMTEVFKAPDVVGQRAMEFLDLVLLVISYPEDVTAIWEVIASDDIVQTNTLLQRIYQRMLELPHDYGDETEAKVRLLNALSALRTYTQRITGRDEVTVAEAVQVLRNRLGQGHYEFEFRRRLRALQ
jgi:ABC-type transport system involved in cytochrome c biogenesis ATPase subunit